MRLQRQTASSGLGIEQVCCILGLPETGLRRFSRLGQVPLELILEKGESGLVQVQAELDCTFFWELNSSGSS